MQFDINKPSFIIHNLAYVETIVNTYILIKIVQATSYVRPTFHPSVGTLSSIYYF